MPLFGQKTDQLEEAVIEKANAAPSESKVLVANQFTETIKQMELEKEVDPNGVGQHDSGAKCDFNKPDCSLLGMFGNALTAVAQVGTLGAEKYTRGGWQHVPDGVNRYTAAMLRHYLKEDTSRMDDDLPVLHAAQVAWNALARLELMIRDYNNSDEAERIGG